MVELEDEVVGELRCARRVRALTDDRLPLLPELLRRKSSESGPSTRHLMVVASGPGPSAPAVGKPATLPRRAELGLAAG